MAKQTVERVTESTVNAGRDKLIAVFTEPRLLEAEIQRFRGTLTRIRVRQLRTGVRRFPTPPTI